MSATLITLGVLALLVGVVFLVVDARRRSLRTRIRREWAGHHAARYAAADPVLTGQWRYGVFSRGGAGRALDLVSGEPDGTRLYLFDLEQAHAVVCTVLALRRPTTSETALELRMGSSTAATGAEATQTVEPEPVSEAGMDLLGHVGERWPPCTPPRARDGGRRWPRCSPVSPTWSGCYRRRSTASDVT